MALSDDNGMVMPVAPMYGSNGGYGGGLGGFGGDWGWIILLLLIANGGWGGGLGGFGGMGGFAADGAMLYPWMNQAEVTNSGFQNQTVNDGITSVRDSVSALSNQLCNCCSDMQGTMANGFANVEQGANSRQMANMNQMFAAQTAMMQGFNNVQSQIADSFGENRLANCQTQNIIQNEGNATRFADANNTRDIIENANRNNQSILDKLCQLEMDNYRRENDQLRSQLQFANMQASQVAQTAELRAAAQTANANLLTELRSCPIPAQAVYGNQPVFTCGAQSNCGCGCSGF